ncbi:hypothetical protein DFH05DRAFT_1558582 [Lentinula detonsa]|uniref:Uncharacterized protein n=1 Tax=Lentinula detonsa TaxID=2804962 RepID=A0A9W8NX90_9AGAR|nr:hypothetical protein DFH05DRAFT_1558582 [Lentinula detonsa]
MYPGPVPGYYWYPYASPSTPTPIIGAPNQPPSTPIIGAHVQPPSVICRATGEDTIEVPEASDKVPSVGTVAVTQGGTRKGYTVLGSVMGLQRSFRQCSLHVIWVSLRSAKKKEVPERRTEPIDRSGRD